MPEQVELATVLCDLDSLVTLVVAESIATDRFGIPPKFGSML
jgi:hypothetical protein